MIVLHIGGCRCQIVFTVFTHQNDLKVATEGLCFNGVSEPVHDHYGNCVFVRERESVCACALL